MTNKPRIRMDSAGFWRIHRGGFGFIGQSGPWPTLKAAWEASANFLEALEQQDPDHYAKMKKDAQKRFEKKILDVYASKNPGFWGAFSPQPRQN